MSRTVITAVVAVVIVALTGLAYALISSSIEDRNQRDSQSRVLRARQMLEQTVQLDVVSTLSKAERLAADEGFVRRCALAAWNGPTPPSSPSSGSPPRRPGIARRISSRWSTRAATSSR